MKKNFILTLLSLTSFFSGFSQTFSSGFIDIGDQCANVFSCVAKSSTDTVYGFWRDGDGTSAVYKLIKWTGTSWTSVSSFNMSQVSSGASFTEAYDGVSMAIDASGGYHVAISGAVAGSCCNQERGVAYGYSANGSSWSFTKIQSSTDPNGWLNYDSPQIKLDKNDNPNIVFMLSDANNPRAWTLRHYKKTGSWTGQNIFSQVGGTCLCNEINDFAFALDTSGRVHVAFQRETNGTGLDGGLWYVYDNAGSFTSPTELIAGATNLEEGYDPNITIDTNNHVYIISSNYGDTLKETTNKTGPFVTTKLNSNLTGQTRTGTFSMNATGDKFFTYKGSNDYLYYALQLNGASTWTIDTISTNYHDVNIYISSIITDNRNLLSLFDVRPAGACSTINRELWYGYAVVPGASCTAPTVPTVTGGSRCPSGGSVSLGISGTLNGASKWYIYTGSCGGTILDSTSSGSFSVSPSSTTTYYIRGEGNCVTPGSCGSATVTVNTNSAIGSVSASTSTICIGTADTLTANGVTAGTGATLTWYTATGGGGSNLGTSNPLYHTPTGTTTYYARLAGTCNTLEASTTVTVNTNSAIGSVSASTSTICIGTADTLTANGVTAGTGATLTWYTATGGGGSNLGTTNPLYHTPTGTTTYYARLAGTCNTVEQSATVTVNTNSAITSVTASQPVICEGNEDTLTANGVTAGTGATLTWYTATGGGGTNLGTTNPLYHTPTGTIAYYARLAGTCNTVEQSATVTVNTNSAITSVTASAAAVCIGNADTLTANGVTVGTGATLTWYTATAGGGTNLGTTNPLYHTPTGNTTYYARLAGTCNTVEANTSVSINALPVISSVTSSRNPTTNGYAPYQCADLTATATGAGSLNYDWSNAATGSVINVCPTSGTTYAVLVTDGNGCMKTDTIRQSVVEGTSPYPGRVIMCYTYPRRAPMNINIYPNQVPQYLNAGATLGACGSSPSKRNAISTYDDIYRIYPNPTQNQITVEWFNMFNEEVNIELVDMTGRVVRNIYNGQVIEGEISLITTDISTLPVGMYLIRYSSPTDIRINKVQLMR